MIKKLFIVIWCILLLTGCATTQVSSILDSGFNEKQRTVSRVIVIAPFKDFDTELKVEKIFVKYLKKLDIKALSRFQVLSPDRKYTNRSLKETLTKQQVDTVIAIYLADPSVGEEHVSLSRHNGKVFNLYDYCYGKVSPLTLQLEEAYASWPFIRCEIYVVDVNTEKVRWEALTLVRGWWDYDLESNTILRCLARNVVRKFYKESLIKRNKWKYLLFKSSF